MTPPAWSCEPYDVAAAVRLQNELGLGPTAATILVRRGHADPGAARGFLAAATRTPAGDLPGAGAACDLILRHVRAGSRIVVFGDYDVDGVCATAMMVRALRALGASPGWRLPSRAEGYGLGTEAVEQLAAQGTELLITVDCGVTSTAEVARAVELGLDVCVTDHHRPGPSLPSCAVVHPALGPLGRDGPAGELCAAGVVLKLSEALRGAAGLDPAVAEEDIDLAGLATVCDMVPLRDENRRIARQGLEALSRTEKEGLRALMCVAGLEPAEVDSTAASFRLGPRINAAGRLHRADAALELLLTDDPGRAEEVANELDLLNRDRRETEQRILGQAEAQCAGQMSRAALVVAGEDWHPGVVGIVASRLARRFHRPAVVIALEGDAGRGSGRSIASYDLHEGLAAAAGHLLGFGGHRMAAGLQIEAGRVPAFRRELAAHAAARLSPEDLTAVEHVDAVVPGSALDLGTAEELERLGPFGSGNPEPTLLVPAARIEHVTAMGEERTHARFSLVSGGTRARAVAFRRSQRSLAAAGPHDVAVGLERNHWNGAVEARVVLRSLSATRAGRIREVGDTPFWDLVATELECAPAAWCEPWIGPPGRLLRDRRDQGLAGVMGDVLSTSEEVLVVVTDSARRAASLSANVAGLARGGELRAVPWAALAARPELAEPYAHLVAVDPPPVAELAERIASAPGPGTVHLAWGAAEVTFTRAYWHAQLHVRDAMADLWRALGRGPLEAHALERVLRGEGAHPRDGALAGRVLRVLDELGLVELDLGARTCQALSAGRTDIEQSAAHRAYVKRLGAVEAYLAGALSVTPERLAARAA